MDSETVKEKGRPQQGFREMAPEAETLERRISNVARQLLAANLQNRSPEQKAGLEKQMNDLLKQRPTRMPAAPVQKPAVIVSTQETVSSVMSDGKISYSQGAASKLTEFAVRQPKGPIVVHAA